jgi:formylglycine-generating enzyme required for sulfatase activity
MRRFSLARQTLGLAALILACSRGSEPQAPRQPEARTRTCAPDALPEGMQRIEGGRFDMGALEHDRVERPVHAVDVNTFMMGIHEVTVGEYARCVEAKVCSEPLQLPNCSWGKARKAHPVTCVSWQQATDYCGFTCARLPSEEEWEFAARSGVAKKTYPWGEEEADCSRAVMGTVEGTGCGQGTTSAVCSKAAGNSLHGLCDLAGNAWEWTASTACDYGTGECWEHSSPVRGGSWSNTAYHLRAAARMYVVRTEPVENVGFRCAASVAD